MVLREGCMYEGCLSTSTRIRHELKMLKDREISLNFFTFIAFNSSRLPVLRLVCFFFLPLTIIVSEQFEGNFVHPDSAHIACIVLGLCPLICTELARLFCKRAWGTFNWNSVANLRDMARTKATNAFHQPAKILVFNLSYRARISG